MNTYYLVRHGQTEWNTQGRTQGHGNSPLTDLGISQAQNLAKALREYPIDMIYCSDLGRAVQTAQIVGKELNLDVVATDKLREMGFGVWEGMKMTDIETEYADLFNLWRNQPDKLLVPGGEMLKDIKKRQDELIDYLNEKYKNKHILLVSHSVTVRVMLLSMLDSDIKNIYRIRQDNTAINTVEYKDYGPVIKKINDTAHLVINGGVNAAKSALE